MTIGTDSGSGPTRQIPGKMPERERARERAHRWHLLMYKQHTTYIMYHTKHRLCLFSLPSLGAPQEPHPHGPFIGIHAYQAARAEQ